MTTSSQSRSTSTATTPVLSGRCPACGKSPGWRGLRATRSAGDWSMDRKGYCRPCGALLRAERPLGVKFAGVFGALFGVLSAFYPLLMPSASLASLPLWLLIVLGLMLILALLVTYYNEMHHTRYHLIDAHPPPPWRPAAGDDSGD